MHRWLTSLALACAFPATAVAQDTTWMIRREPTATLSLQEALAQARLNSPAFRQAQNGVSPARWGVRQAYGQLLPQGQVSGSLGWQGSGQQVVGGVALREISASYNSSYFAGFQWNFDGRRLTAPGQQKALLQAAERDVDAADVQLRFDVTDQYLAVLSATAQVEAARQQVKRNEEFLKLAQARYEVGQATLIDVRQAEVTRGNGRIALLRALQAENEAKLELFRRIGSEAPVMVTEVALSDSFPVQAPSLELGGLQALAERQNPALQALAARERAADRGVGAARSQYLPSLQVQGGWSGFTNQFTDRQLLLNQALAGAQGSIIGCQFDNQVRTGFNFQSNLVVPDCNARAGLDATGAALRPEVSQAILDRNNIFPFRFQSQPFQANLQVSLPLFTGFSRRLQVAQARQQQQNADEQLRAQRLLVRTQVASRYLGVQTAYTAIEVQGANREAAREQLQLARDRYRVGNGNALELSDAENGLARAESDYITAVYSYHRALVALEAAVGRSIR